MSTHQVIPIRPNLRPESALIGEANHRVANHLAILAGLIQTQSAKFASGPAFVPREEVRAALREVAGKVVSVGHYHRRLVGAHADAVLDLGEYLVESSHALIKALALESRVGIVHRLGTRCRVRQAHVQPLALIVNEVIMNAIKHAHPTAIPVEICIHCDVDEKGRIRVDVEDDGVGFPENFNPHTDGGTGFHLIRTLAASVGADLDIQSDSLGARFRITLPADMRAA